MQVPGTPRVNSSRWCRPPGLRPTPPSACWCGTRASRADQGVCPTMKQERGEGVTKFYTLLRIPLFCLTAALLAAQTSSQKTISGTVTDFKVASLEIGVKPDKG